MFRAWFDNRKYVPHPFVQSCPHMNDYLAKYISYIFLGQFSLGKTTYLTEYKFSKMYSNLIWIQYKKV